MGSVLIPRYDWCENQSTIVVYIFAKDPTEEKLQLKIFDQLVDFLLLTSGKDVYHIFLELADLVLPNECSYNLRSNKVEITLVKAVPAYWQRLTKGSRRSSNTSTSTKDWDSIAKQEDSKTSIDDSAQSFLQELYDKADDDTRRAMNKSFLESNGTVLSTNWSEVGAKKIEPRHHTST